jgi:hypothetical protein
MEDSMSSKIEWIDVIWEPVGGPGAVDCVVYFR